ncbi:hypothetical protein, partial [Streptococcus danieliae]|uniref:hypothetical protein n=1 Tax=Streptococcus danieliae TaxID=747656 RepID=UPI001F205DDF
TSEKYCPVMTIFWMLCCLVLVSNDYNREWSRLFKFKNPIGCRVLGDIKVWGTLIPEPSKEKARLLPE